MVKKCAETVKSLDIYGLSAAPAAVYNPAAGPKTFAGVVFSLLSVGAVGTLMGFYLYGFLRTDMGVYSNTLGDPGA